MTKRQMLTNSYALAFGQPIEDTSDLRLLGVDAIKKSKADLRSFAIEQLLLQNVIPTKQNFFYKVEHYDNDSYSRNLISEEYGVGEIYKKGRGTFLKREFVTRLIVGTQEQTVDHDKFYKYPNSDFLLVKSYIPSNYLEIFAYPFSVLCSIERNIPTPVELEENTLLGRLDNTIQSIDKDELRRIFTDEAIIDAVNNNKSSLILLSKFVELLDNDAKFFAPSISLKAIYTNKKKPPKPARGTIIFNDQAGCFEGFDGVSWRKLKWGDE